MSLGVPTEPGCWLMSRTAASTQSHAAALPQYESTFALMGAPVGQPHMATVLATACNPSNRLGMHVLCAHAATQAWCLSVTDFNRPLAMSALAALQYSDHSTEGSEKA